MATRSKLKPEARQYLAQGPDLASQLGALCAGGGAALRCPGCCCRATRDIRRGVGAHSDSARAAVRPRKPYPRRRARVAVVGSRDADEARSRAGATLRVCVCARRGGGGVRRCAGQSTPRRTKERSWGEGRSVARAGERIGRRLSAPKNRNLFERLATGGGAVVSELAPGTEPVGQEIPAPEPDRRRLVGCRSGSPGGLALGALITARPGRSARTRSMPSGRALELEGRGVECLAAGRAGFWWPQARSDVLTDLGWPIPEILVSTAATRTGAAGIYPGEPVQPDSHCDRCGRRETVALLDGRTLLM